MDTQIVHVERVSSTQDMARDMTPPAVGTVIVADVQEAGRGRHGHVWLSPRGGLYTSIVLKGDPLLSPRIGVAVARALQRAGISAQLKWPNDVLVHDKKIAGILIEVVKEVAIVGIGVNIDKAPLPESTCLTSETSRLITRDDLLHAILLEIETTYAENIIETYRRLCMTMGKKVEVNLGQETIAGLVLGVDQFGHLVLKTAQDSRIINSGECRHLDALSTWQDPANVLV